jgi:hypothetical protein
MLAACQAHVLLMYGCVMVLSICTVLVITFSALKGTRQSYIPLEWFSAVGEVGDAASVSPPYAAYELHSGVAHKEPPVSSNG